MLLGINTYAWRCLLGSMHSLFFSLSSSSLPELASSRRGSKRLRFPMAADVSSVVRVLGRYGREDSSNGDGSSKADLVTKDLLGGCCDVDGGGGGVAPSPVPNKATLPGIYVFSEGGEHLQAMELNLNLPPVCISDPPAIVCAAPQDQITSSPTPDPRLRRSLNQSICTLETVKSALERAERESRQWRPRQQLGVVQGGSASPTSSSTTTSSAKRRLGGGAEGGEEAGSRTEMEWAVVNEDGGGGAELAAAACPSCMTYVLVRASSPRCPRCSILVPLPPTPQRLPGAAGKKARIDLNADALADTPTAITFF